MNENELRHQEYYPRHIRSDRLKSLSWALILIWAGTVFLADNIGMLDRLSLPFGGWDMGFVTPSAWTLIFLGAGLIVLLEAVLRMMLPSYAQPNGGRLILAAVLIGVGLSNMFRSELIWPLVIIGVGVSILFGSLMRRNPA